jgi:hypothetical protein
MRSTLACEVPGAMRHPQRTADLGSDMALGPELRDPLVALLVEVGLNSVDMRRTV